jgi:hypothetical protein
MDHSLDGDLPLDDKSPEGEATEKAAGFIGVPGKPLLLAGLILNPPNTADKIKGP